MFSRQLDDRVARLDLTRDHLVDHRWGERWDPERGLKAEDPSNPEILVQLPATSFPSELLSARRGLGAERLGCAYVAPVAQGIEHSPPERGAQVRILPGHERSEWSLNFSPHAPAELAIRSRSSDGSPTDRPARRTLRPAAIFLAM